MHVFHCSLTLSQDGDGFLEVFHVFVPHRITVPMCVCPVKLTASHLFEGLTSPVDHKPVINFEENELNHIKCM